MSASVAHLCTPDGFGPAKRGGVQGEEGRRVGGAAGRKTGGELIAGGLARPGSTEESGGLFHPSSTGLLRGAGALLFVRPPRQETACQCPASVCRSGRGMSHSLCCGRLASRRLHSTRLETRTKECSSGASRGVVETPRAQ